MSGCWCVGVREGEKDEALQADAGIRSYCGILLLQWVCMRRAAVLSAAHRRSEATLAAKPTTKSLVRGVSMPLRAADSVGAGRRASQQVHRRAAACVTLGRGARFSILSFRAAAVLLALAAAVSTRKQRVHARPARACVSARVRRDMRGIVPYS